MTLFYIGIAIGVILAAIGLSYRYTAGRKYLHRLFTDYDFYCEQRYRYECRIYAEDES